MGKPLIATDVPGCCDIVAHGVNGLLVPARDPAPLAQAMLHWPGIRPYGRQWAKPAEGWSRNSLMKPS